MDQPSPDGRTVRFGLFEVDLAAALLRKRGHRVKLEAQPFQVLTILLRRPGELVTRDELQKELWSEDTFVEFDHSLNTAVKKIRQALGDSSRNPRFIETAPRQGYRFIAAVDGPEHALAHKTGPSGRWVAGGVALLVLIGTSTWYWLTQNPQPSGLKPVVTPLTTYPGIETKPTFSPDGSQVAFQWIKQGGVAPDIYVKVIGEEEPLQLTNHPAMDTSPAWSPGGRWIAFLRDLGQARTGVFLVSPTGGGERQVASVDFLASPGFGPYLSWTPDSSRLAVVHRASASEPCALHLVTLDTGRMQRLTTPPAGAAGDSNPSFSQAGDKIAFTRSSVQDEHASELFVLSLSPGYLPRGEPKQVTFEGGYVGGMAWTAGGEALCFRFGPHRHSSSLWTIPVTGNQKPSRIEYAGPDSGDPAISRDGRRLVFSRWNVDVNVWEMVRENPASEFGSARPVTASTLVDHSPQFAPSDGRIGFVSYRSGNPELWLSSPGNFAPKRLTFNKSPRLDGWRWSPDGDFIAFAAGGREGCKIFIVGPRGEAPQQLTSGLADDIWPEWSPDARSLYFTSNRTGEFEVWKIPADGGEPLQVTRNSGYKPRLSPDGTSLYYLKRGPAGSWDSASLWRAAPDGRGESFLLGQVWYHNYEVVGAGVYFIPAAGFPAEDTPDGRSIQFYDFATGKINSVALLPNTAMWGLSVSPDGRKVQYAIVDRSGADLMLVENFR